MLRKVLWFVLGSESLWWEETSVPVYFEVQGVLDSSVAMMHGDGLFSADVCTVTEIARGRNSAMVC